VATNFCLDGICTETEMWFELNRRLVNLVEPGGLYVTTAIRNGQFWGTGGEHFSAVTLTSADLTDAYSRLGLSVAICREVDLAARPGYDGILMIAGKREASTA
jgi:hypothetical protein